MIEVIRLILKIILGIFYRVTIVNKQNLPETGAVIPCSNHIGEMDMFFIGYKIKRLVHYMAKEELFKIPVLGPVIRYFGAFPVKRGVGDVGAIKTSLRLLSEGKVLGIFAEGTRMKKGKTARIKPGVAMLAARSGAPILPVAIKGSYRLFGRVMVIFGEPFYLDADKSRKYMSEELAEMSRDIMDRVYKLLEVN